MEHAAALSRQEVVWALMLQLLGLATPLFTQTIIDKVVVHQTFSTLTVIGVALFVCMAFSALMSWVRQYLILHTGNRVDAVLGTQVFEHLIKLPLRYFEHRPTGVVVARLQGVETIREFISSAAITFLLDLPFLFLFLGIMLHYSVPLSLISVVILGAIVLMSLAIAPRFRERLNHQFLVGANGGTTNRRYGKRDGSGAPHRPRLRAVGSARAALHPATRRCRQGHGERQDAMEYGLADRTVAVPHRRREPEQGEPPSHPS
ncbi:MAG: ABC transporter transmembrane domain-containing protein [Steroidobacteraceae bacterium]